MAPGDVPEVRDHDRDREPVRQRDYLLLEYAEGDKVYVPTDQVDRVQKYIGSADSPPTITRLHSGEWARATKRAKKQVAEMAADLIKLAMIRIDAALQERGLKSRMTLQVHDELVFEVPEKEVDTMQSLVREHMERVQALAVPLLVEMEAGPNWRDLD